MKKIIAIIALAAFGFGNAALAAPNERPLQDTITKTKVKKKDDKVKIKKKKVKRDTTVNR